MKDLSINNLVFDDRGPRGLLIHFGVERVGQLSQQDAERLEKWLKERNTQARITIEVLDPNSLFF